MMADQSTIVLTWLSISLGVICVIAGIAIVTLVGRAIGFGLSEVFTSGIGAVIGLGFWLVWLSYRSRRDV